MPTYVYKCPSCGKTVEYFHNMNESPEYKCECGAILKVVPSGGTNTLYKVSGFTKYKGRNGS